MASDPLKIEVPRVDSWRLEAIRRSVIGSGGWAIEYRNYARGTAAIGLGSTLEKACKQAAEMIGSPQSANQILEAARKVLGVEA